MKKGCNILLMVCAILMAMSCNKTKTYTDMLNDQRKAIDKLIANEDLVILKDYPDDGVFGDNEFVKLDNGIYLNVVDSGNGNRAVLGKTKIFSRFSTVQLIGDTTIYSNYGPHSNGTNPVEFLYGDYTSIIKGGAVSIFESYAEERFNSEGLQAPLQYVGNNSKVKIIIPFQKGSSYDNSKGLPRYVEIIEYKFNE